MRKARVTTRSPGRPTRPLTGPRPRQQPYRRGGAYDHLGLHADDDLMGGGVTLDLTDPAPREELIQLAEDVFAWLRHVDHLFSTYRPDSEVSRLRRGEMRIAECSREVRMVVDHCADHWKATNGYFDPYSTGDLDAGGFVKGWALQVASDRLVARGSENHRLSAGGDVRVRGRTATGQPWRVNIRHPWQPHAVSWVVAGTDLAVATSDCSERGAQIIDPYRRRPATQLRAVTVVGGDLGVADAYSTAAFAMGRDALTWLAGLERHEAAVVTEDGRFFRSEGLPVADDIPAPTR